MLISSLPIHFRTEEMYVHWFRHCHPVVILDPKLTARFRTLTRQAQLLTHLFHETVVNHLSDRHGARHFRTLALQIDECLDAIGPHIRISGKAAGTQPENFGGKSSIVDFEPLQPVGVGRRRMKRAVG
jgi:hypothetical protein